MSASRTANSESLSLTSFTETERKTPSIAWYRSPVPPAEMKALHKRSDLRGFAQTLGYLAIVCLTGGASLYLFAHGHWWWTALALLAHGTCTAFMINGVHELGHGTVFRTKIFNAFFVHLFAFVGWINHETFQTSHARHHRYTLHPPDDLEVTLPIKIFVRNLLKWGLFNPMAMPGALRNTWRIARGRFEGNWELALYPPADPSRRRVPVRWARLILLGHATILALSIWQGWWLLPVVVSLTPMYGGWLFQLCNNTQHVGLHDNVADFRLCCRTFTLNPFVRLLYWQMNFHVEHHMFAAVPCYHLPRLHALIKNDLPPCADGIVAVWSEISEIVSRQQADPQYRHAIALPVAQTA